jgi:hypothetical protein
MSVLAGGAGTWLRLTTSRSAKRCSGASLLGRDVRVTRGARRPSAHRLLVGDRSEVELAEGS